MHILSNSMLLIADLDTLVFQPLSYLNNKFGFSHEKSYADTI